MWPMILNIVIILICCMSPIQVSGIPLNQYETDSTNNLKHPKNLIEDGLEKKRVYNSFYNEFYNSFYAPSRRSKIMVNPGQKAAKKSTLPKNKETLFKSERTKNLERNNALREKRIFRIFSTNNSSPKISNKISEQLKKPRGLFQPNTRSTLPIMHHKIIAPKIIAPKIIAPKTGRKDKSSNFVLESLEKKSGQAKIVSAYEWIFRLRNPASSQSFDQHAMFSANLALNDSVNLWNWEGLYEVEDLTNLNGRELARRSLLLTDTGSNLGLIASLYDEEFSCRIFSNLIYSESEKTIKSDQTIGYNSPGKLEIRETEIAGNLLGFIELPNLSNNYEFKARKTLDAPLDASIPCSLNQIIGDYKGLVGDIPGIINIELNQDDSINVVFTSDQYGSMSSEIEATYFQKSGRLFMINQKTNYPFIWRLIAAVDNSNTCSISGFTFSTFNSQLRPAKFTRIQNS